MTDPSSGWEGSRRPAASRLAPVGLALVAVIVVGWLVRADAVEPPPDGELLVEPEAEPAPAEDGSPGIDEAVDGEALAQAGGRWQLLETSPVAPPRRHTSAWTGRELVVFGGGGEVAAYDAANRLWWRRQPVPATPGAAGPAVLREPTVDPVWTGEEVLVLTGPTSDAREARMTAAAFDPEADAWRLLPPPPVTVAPPAASVWTGAEWFVWGRAGGPRIREDGPPIGAVYDPAADRWRRLPDAPVLLVDAVGGVAAGDHVVVWGQRPGPDLRARGEGAFALRYHPADGRWEALPAPPVADPARAAGAWTGACGAPDPSPSCGQVLLWGAAEADRPPDAAAVGGARLDVATLRWRPLPSVPELAGRGSWRQAAAAAGLWTGDRFVVVGGPGAVGLTLDGALRWRRLPPRPPLLAPSLAWTGDELLVWGGYGRDGSSAYLRAWRP